MSQLEATVEPSHTLKYEAPIGDINKGVENKICLVGKTYLPLDLLTVSCFFSVPTLLRKGAIKASTFNNHTATADDVCGIVLKLAIISPRTE